MPVTTGQLDIEDDYDVQYKSLRRLHPEFDFQTEKQARKILFYGKNKSGRLYKIASVYDRQHSESESEWDDRSLSSQFRSIFDDNKPLDPSLARKLFSSTNVIPTKKKSSAIPTKKKSNAIPKKNKTSAVPMKKKTRPLKHVDRTHSYPQGDDKPTLAARIRSFRSKEESKHPRVPLLKGKITKQTYYPPTRRREQQKIISEAPKYSQPRIRTSVLEISVSSEYTKKTVTSATIPELSNGSPDTRNTSKTFNFTPEKRVQKKKVTLEESRPRVVSPALFQPLLKLKEQQRPQLSPKAVKVRRNVTPKNRLPFKQPAFTPRTDTAEDTITSIGYPPEMAAVTPDLLLNPNGLMACDMKLVTPSDDVGLLDVHSINFDSVEKGSDSDFSMDDSRYDFSSDDTDDITHIDDADFLNRLQGFVVAGQDNIVEVIQNLDEIQRKPGAQTLIDTVTSPNSMLRKIRIAQSKSRSPETHKRSASVSSRALRRVQSDDMASLMQRARKSGLIPQANLFHPFKELLESERRYVEVLTKIQSDFLAVMERQNILARDSKLRNHLSVVYDLLKFHEEFLEKTMASGDGVDTLFVDRSIQSKLMKLYVEYTTKYKAIDYEIQRLCLVNKSFNEFLDTKGADNQDIYLYLLTPITRVAKYELLVREMLKRDPENMRLRSAATGLKKINTLINKKKKEFENLDSYKHVRELIKNYDDSLWEVAPTSQGRRFIEKFKCVSNTQMTCLGWMKKAQVFVFSDILIICDNSLNFLLQIALAEVSRIKSKGKNISLFYGNYSDCFVMGAPNKQEANRVGEFLSTAADECFNRSSPQKSMSLSVPFYMDDVSNPSPRLSISDFLP